MLEGLAARAGRLRIGSRDSVAARVEKRGLIKGQPWREEEALMDRYVGRWAGGAVSQGVVGLLGTKREGGREEG